MINRRNVLKATAVGGSGLAALAYSPKPTLAANGWTVNNPATVSNDNGELSSLELKEEDFTMSEFSWSNLGSGDHKITVTFSAGEIDPDDDSSQQYYEIATGSFTVTGDSGSISSIPSWDTNPFPVNFFNASDISKSVFSASRGTTEETDLDFKLNFSHDDTSARTEDAFTVSVEHVSPEAVIDDFEDDNLDEYSGDTSAATIVDSPAKTGSALQIDVDTSQPSITSKTGLNAYPKAGDTFESYWQVSEADGYFWASWGVQDDESNRYQIKLGEVGEEIILQKVSGGTPNKLDSDSHSWNPDEWYRSVVQWNEDGYIEVNVYNSSGNNVATVSGTDDEWSSGGIKFEGVVSSGNTQYYIDEAYIL